MKRFYIYIVRSEIWCTMELDEITNLLNETVNEFVDDDDKIINIEVKENNGVKRFWIYVERFQYTCSAK